MKLLQYVLLSGLAGLSLLSCSEDMGFSLIKNPQVDSVEPNEGPTRGGQQVVVMGENFIANTEIYFDDKPCRDVEIINETEIHCVSPVHDAGEATVKGTSNSGTGERTATYTFTPPPEFSLHPGDEVGYTKINLNYCDSDFCTPENEQEAAWRSSWIVESDGVNISELTGQWEVKAHYFHQVTEGASDPAALQSAWMSEYGPYDQATDYAEDGVATYTTSVPPVPALGDGSISFPFFDMSNFETAADAFREYVRSIDPEAAIESQQASRSLEAYYVDNSSPRQAHHVLIIFHSIGIVCHMSEEVAQAAENPSRNQGDFTGVLVTPKADMSFAYVMRVGGTKQYCNCSSDSGCE